MYPFEHNNCKIHWRDTKTQHLTSGPVFNEVEIATGTQLPKLLSLHLRTSLWFYQTSRSGTFFFHARVNEKRVPDHLRFAFLNEMIKLRRQFVRMKIHEKKQQIDSKLTTAIKLYVNVNWETTFLPLWREELNKIFFLVNSNISVSKPASFNKDIPILQFC